MRRWRVWLSMADEGPLYALRSIRNRQEYGRATLSPAFAYSTSLWK